ncbi:hypothetical protein ACFY3N_16835 [Streptomyces sp. NPDC000348]|uniref:hypothetical protein n=1 Tax=Streptomyces sp. NPDC000348 TaxID=3364538 RepID=UPI0036C79E41
MGSRPSGASTPAKGEAPPFHAHNDEDEVFPLLSGSAPARADDEDFGIPAQLLAEAAEPAGRAVPGRPR